MHYLLLERGHLYRWSCDASGVQQQAHVFRTHASMIVTPLARAGHRVDVWAALSLAYACERSLSLRTLFPDATDMRAQQLWATSQSASVRLALDWLIDSAPTFDTLMLMRSDVALKTPISSWACNPARTRTDTIYVPGRLEDYFWRRYNMTQDLFFVVPRPMLGAFDRTIGRQDRGGPRLDRWSFLADCCFALGRRGAQSGCVKDSGHGCYRPLLKEAHVNFCWDHVPHFNVQEINEYYEVPRCGGESGLPLIVNRSSGAAVEPRLESNGRCRGTKQKRRVVGLEQAPQAWNRLPPPTCASFPLVVEVGGQVVCTNATNAMATTCEPRRMIYPSCTPSGMNASTRREESSWVDTERPWCRWRQERCNASAVQY